MFDRQELYEYFATYSKSSIDLALLELSKYDDSINPNGQVFNDSITEQLEGVLEVTEQAINNSPVNQLAETKQLAIKLAQEKGLQIDARVFDAMLRLCVEENIARAKIFHEVGQAAFRSSLAHLQGEELKAATEQHIKKLHVLNLLLNDGDRLEEILQEYSINTKQVEESIEVEVQDSFNADEYYQELVKGKEPKKPTTRHGSKQLVIAMLG